MYDFLDDPKKRMNACDVYSAMTEVVFEESEQTQQGKWDSKENWTYLPMKAISVLCSPRLVKMRQYPWELICTFVN